MRIDYNECWFQEGFPRHDACLHQNYCVLNSNRVNLEAQIEEIRNNLEFVEELLTNFHSVYVDKSYADLKKEKMILKKDLENLLFFRSKIIDNEVEDYGFKVLES